MRTLFFVFISLAFVQYCVAQSTNQFLWSTVNGASNLVTDGRGNVFASSPKENIIYQLSNGNGQPDQFAGTGTAGFVDGDAFTTAQFNGPQGMAFDHSNEILYVCDTGNNAIRKVYQGVVTTLDATVIAPVSISLVTGNRIPQSPPGFYVLSENGTLSLVQDGPVNDDCNSAVDLGTISPNTPLITYGNIDKATIDTGFYPCEHNPNVGIDLQFPAYTVWYKFKGSGNLVNVSICNSQTDLYADIFVYRAADPSTDDSCDNLLCIDWVYPNNHGHCYGSINQVCTQPNITYYVAVSVDYYFDETYLGNFELAIFDMGPNQPLCAPCTCNGVQCPTNQCRSFCGNAPQCTGDQTCVGGTCFANAPNDQCDGAIAISGNSSVVFNLVTDVAPLTPVNGEGNCQQIRNRGLWYQATGTGFLTVVTTCSSKTQIATRIHLYKAVSGSSCTELLECVDISGNDYEYQCPYFDTSNLIYCGEEGATYYYYVEAASNLGIVEITQQFTDSTCIVGNDYGKNNYYYYSSFFEIDEESW